MCISSLAPGRNTRAESGPSRRDLLQRLLALGLSMPMAAAAVQGAARAAPGPMSNLDRQGLVEGLKDLITRAKSPEVESFCVFDLGSTDMPWKTIDLKAAKGQEVTFLLGGRIWLSREYDLWAEPGAGFHARSLGARPIYNPMSNTGTMTAAHDGGIEIARSLGEWQDEDGVLWTPKEDYQKVDVEMYGVAIAWRGDAAKGVKSLMAHGDVEGVLGVELARIESPRKLPEGWNNLFMLGGGPVIFNDIGHGEIACQTCKNAGILEYPVAIDLKPGTKLNWRWIIEELPSRFPEDQAATHDYLSIGAKFDDGQDLTYIWSHSLPVGKVFRCPLARWTPIETHKIIRSGPENLGTWVDEEQDLFADYTAHIGGKAKSIVRIWLLGVSVFQRLNGTYRVGDIQIAGPDNKSIKL
jgi:Protein of unknown function (DUF3047)